MKPAKLLGPSIKVTITVALLALVFRQVDPAELGSHLRSIDKGRIALLLLAWWGGQLLCAQRWRQFAIALGMPGTYRTYLQMYFVGMLFNVGLPSLVGGDVVKAYAAARRSGRPMHTGVASVLQDRAIGMVSLVVYGTIAVILMPLSWRRIPLWLPYVALWAGLATFSWVVFRGERWYRRHLTGTGVTFMHRLRRFLAHFHRDFATMKLTPRAALEVLTISFVNSAIVLWMYEQVAVALGRPVGLVGFSALYPLIAFVTMLPISLGGIGLREWAYMEGLALVGMPRDVALAVALTTSALNVVANLAGLFFLHTMPLELRKAPSDLDGEDDDSPRG